MYETAFQAHLAHLKLYENDENYKAYVLSQLSDRLDELQNHIGLPNQEDLNFEGSPIQRPPAANDKKNCEACDVSLNYSSWNRHLKSKKHQKKYFIKYRNERANLHKYAIIYPEMEFGCNNYGR